MTTIFVKNNSREAWVNSYLEITKNTKEDNYTIDIHCQTRELLIKEDMKEDKPSKENPSEHSPVFFEL